MATGATDEFWERRKLPSVFKHALLSRYIPIFGGKTGSTHGQVVVLDGYAGRGRHENGSPGSAELILRTARGQASAGRGIRWSCFLFEKDPDSFAHLKVVADEYAAQGVEVAAGNVDVADGLGGVLKAAAGLPLFILLDPCGVGLPFDSLVETLTIQRPVRQPPTEVLLNFSMEAVRRIGGHVASPKGSEASMRSLDRAVGGEWWREHFRGDERHPESVIRGFAERLSNAARMDVVSVPVRRDYDYEPLYYLVLGTRSLHGIWAFSDAVAKAAEDWREAIVQRDSRDALIPAAPRTTLQALEDEAVPDIKRNLAALLDQHEAFQVRDHPGILGDHLGEVRNVVVRKAIKELHAEGLTPSDGKGSPVEGLMVRRPAP